MPQKIKHFIWRACKNVIPTRENLRKRGISIDDTCPRCNKAQDLIYCEMSSRIWFTSFLSLRVANDQNRSFKKWFMNWFNLESSTLLIDTNTIVSIAIFCWFIWKSRNDIIFGNECNAPTKTIFDACRLVHDHFEVVNGKEVERGDYD